MTPRLTAPQREVFNTYAGLALPRHVAYPMPTWWDDLTPADARAMLRDSRTHDDPHDLSIYIHVPFCEQICRYCACTRIAQRKDSPLGQQRTPRFVDALLLEIDMLAETLGPGQTIRQIHWGGGTPTYLPVEQIRRVQDALAQHFTVAPDAEIAIELDPRKVNREILAGLRDCGFERASLGIQDFDPRVQQHVRRIQPVALVRDTVDTCRDLGFRSINFDLIYGLPYQTLDSVRDTISHTIDLRPDRIAFYLYAQIPDRIATQRGLDVSQLPDSETKLEMFLMGQDLLTAGGYQFIGLDHFALPEEGLAQALADGTLQRNFQGMTTGGDLDLVGIGPSSIGRLARIGYLQSVRDVDEYIDRIESGELAIFRGKRFTADDLIRQSVIEQIYCTAGLDPARIEARHGIRFDDYFAREREVLRQFEHDGLIVTHPDGTVAVTNPLGRVLLRTVAAPFDAYLDPDAYRTGDRQYFSANA